MAVVDVETFVSGDSYALVGGVRSRALWIDLPEPSGDELFEGQGYVELVRSWVGPSRELNVTDVALDRWGRMIQRVRRASDLAGLRGHAAAEGWPRLSDRYGSPTERASSALPDTIVAVSGSGETDTLERSGASVLWVGFNGQVERVSGGWFGHQWRLTLGESGSFSGVYDLQVSGGVWGRAWLTTCYFGPCDAWFDLFGSEAVP